MNTDDLEATVQDLEVDGDSVNISNSQGKKQVPGRKLHWRTEYTLYIAFMFMLA